jgi:uncharacterized membrane protein
VSLSTSQFDVHRLGLLAIAALGLALCIPIGAGVAEGNYLPILIGAGVVVVASTMLGMRGNIWMLIPLCLPLSGRLFGGRIPFTVAELAVLLAFGSYVILYALKKAPKAAKLTSLDMLLVTNMVYLATVYARNPAGTYFLESNIVGGRPYFVTLIALLAFWVLQHVTITAKQALFFPILMSIGGAIQSGLGLLTSLMPQFVPIIHPIYSAVDISSYMRESQIGSVDSEGSGRQASLKIFSTTVGFALAAFYRPIELLLFIRPWQSLLFYTALIALMFSGFRSEIVGFAMFLVLASYFRGGLKDVVILALAGVMGLTALIGLQASGVNLPLPVQRAVSFIPGPWEEQVRTDTEGSNEWRFEMWRQALTTDLYIKSKVFGDGFGYDQEALRRHLMMSGPSQTLGSEQMQDYYLIVGAYHSGPVSSIRFVGAIGLVLATILMIGCARYAWRTINRVRPSPYFVLALFIGIPVIIRPFFFWFVFGTLESDFWTIIISLAMLNAINRSFVVWEKNLNREEAVGAMLYKQHALRST